MCLNSADMWLIWNLVLSPTQHPPRVLHTPPPPLCVTIYVRGGNEKYQHGAQLEQNNLTLNLPIFFYSTIAFNALTFSGTITPIEVCVCLCVCKRHRESVCVCSCTWYVLYGISIQRTKRGTFSEVRAFCLVLTLLKVFECSDVV